MADVYRAGIDPRTGAPLPGMRSTVSPAAIAGQAVSEISDRAGRQAERAQRQLAHDEHAWLQNTLATSRAEWNVKLAEAKQNAGAGATGFKDGILKEFDDWKTKAGEAAPPGALQELDVRLNALRSDLTVDALSFETAERVSWQREQMAGSLAASQTAVFAAPHQFESVLKEQTELLAASSIPETIKAKLDREVRGGLAGAYIRGMTERDPARAIALIDANTVPGLQPQDAMVARNGAQAELNRQQSEARRHAAEQRAEQRAAQQDAKIAARFAYEDEIAAASDGRTTGPGVDRAILAAYGERDAAPMLRRLEVTRATAAVAAELATATNEEISSKLSAVAPEGEGYAAEQDGLRVLQQAAQQVLKRRQDDPAAEVVRNYADVREGLASNEPAQIGAALRRSGEIQREVFGLRADQVRPLTGGQAKAIVDQVAAAGTPDQRLALLVPLTAGLRDDATGRQVLGQLEKAGLEAGYRGALDAMQRGDLGAASKIAAAVTVDPKTLPRGDTTGSSINKELDALMMGSGAPAVAARMAMLSGNTAGFKEERETLYRLTAQGVAQGKDADDAAAEAARTVYGDRVAVVDEDVAIALLPKGTNPAAFTVGARNVRAGLDLSHLLPSKAEMATRIAGGQITEDPDGSLHVLGEDGRKPADPKIRGEIEGSYSIVKREVERTIADMKANSVMVETAGGFGLLDTMTGRLISGPDGKPLQWSLADVLTAKRPPGPTWGRSREDGPTWGTRK